MKTLFSGLKSDDYLQHLSTKKFIEKAAEFLTNLNAIHPFRDGNGRTQITFLAILAEFAEHPIDIERLAPEPFLMAMIDSFKGKMAPLETELN